VPSLDVKPTGGAAAGVNLGWKRVATGLRVATVVTSDGIVEHLILPNKWIRRWEHVQALHAAIDAAANDMHASARQHLADMPKWEAEAPALAGISEQDHRLLSRIKYAPKAPIRAMDALAWRLKDIPNLPFAAGIGTQIEAWRKENKRQTLEMDNLRQKIQRERQNLYRTFAARLADQAGAVVMDTSRLKRAARVRNEDGSDPELNDIARSQRVMAATHELRLAIDQAMKKRKGYVETYGDEINHCHTCGSNNTSGDDLVTRACSTCGSVYDVDVNAARNLLDTITAERQRKAG
jgi:hypothetical protein